MVYSKKDTYIYTYGWLRKGLKLRLYRNLQDCKRGKEHILDYEAWQKKKKKENNNNNQFFDDTQTFQKWEKM